MTIDPQEYIRNPFPIVALQITEKNMDEVAEWCGGVIQELNSSRVSGPVKYIKVAVTRPLNERQTQGFVNDWVLKAGRGHKVYTDQAFQSGFRLKPKTVTSIDGNSTEPTVHEDHNYGAQLQDCD